MSAFIVKDRIPQPEPTLHLTPIANPAGEIYYDVLFQTLVGREPFACAAIRCFSTGAPEDAVAMVRHANPRSGRWQLVYVVAKEKIWVWDQEAGQRKPLARGVETERRATEISAELAGLLMAAWSRAMKEVRPAEYPLHMQDANVVVFYANGRSGAASFPGYAGQAALLAKLGGKLADLVRSEPSKVEQLRNECTALAKELAN